MILRYTRILSTAMACLIALAGMLLCPSTLTAAEAFIVIDKNTGHILAGENFDKKRQIASLTKIATGIVTIDWAARTKTDLSQLATVPSLALSQGGANPVGLQAGDQLSLRHLLYAALMQSDNIAAYTIAHHVGIALTRTANDTTRGLAPVDQFIAQMNALARSQGMERTLFLNPHGLDHFKGKPPYSTAADVARLTRYAMANSGFRFYVSQKERKITIHRRGQSLGYQLRSTNRLLGEQKIDGVKTGRTSKAGNCLVVSAERSPSTRKQGETTYVTPRRLVVVVLNSPNRFKESLNLLNSGWQSYDQWQREGHPMSEKSTL